MAALDKIKEEVGFAKVIFSLAHIVVLSLCGGFIIPFQMSMTWERAKELRDKYVGDSNKKPRGLNL